LTNPPRSDYLLTLRESVADRHRDPETVLEGAVPFLRQRERGVAEAELARSGTPSVVAAGNFSER
jgi:hypothetical protein